MPNSNVELLTKVAKRLGPLLREVVFVGGCTTALLITDEAAAEVRPTFDVDVEEWGSMLASSSNLSDWDYRRRMLRGKGIVWNHSEFQVQP